MLETFHRLLTLSDAQFLEGLFTIEVLASVMLLANRLIHRQERPITFVEHRAPKRTILLLLLISLAWLALFHQRWNDPQLHNDDFDLIDDGRDGWKLFEPYNEHMVVPTRILTHLLVGASNLAEVMAFTAIPLFFGCAALLFVFAMREWKSDGAAVLVVALFALTKSYDEVIEWYPATMWLFPFGLLLLALILAQSNRMVLTTLVAMMAPFAYTLGVLVGPLAAIRSRRWLPFFGSVVSAIVLFMLLRNWMSREAYMAHGGRGINSFQPFAAISLIAKLIIDRLFLRSLNLNMLFDPLYYIVAWALLTALLFLAMDRCPAPRRLILPFLLIAVPYCMTIPFRTYVEYEVLYLWSRYNLFPHLGMSLLIVEIVLQMSRRFSIPGARPIDDQSLPVSFCRECSIS